MNQNAQRVIYRFTSDANRAFLQNSLRDLPMDNMSSLISHFVQRISNDLTTSDPIMGVEDQVDCYNKMFIRITRANMEPQDKVALYGVRDGQISSRNTRHERSTPNETLANWQQNVYRGVTGRDDQQNMQRASNPVDVAGGRPICNTQYDPRGRPLPDCSMANFAETGIIFCDQSDVGTSSHTDRFLNNSYIQALNRSTPSDSYSNYAFGDSNPETDARLLGRRIFRDGGDGENTIPNYRRRLHRRPIDKHIDEDIRAPQHEYQQRGHDMQPLRDRIDHIRDFKETIKAQYAPPRPTYYSRDVW